MPTSDDPEKGLPSQSQETADPGRSPSHSSIHSENSGTSLPPEAKESTLDGEAIVAGAVVDARPDAEATDEPLHRSQSRVSSTVSRPLTIISVNKRRGLLSRFTIVPEVSRPYDYKNSTKWGITVTIAVATAAAPLGSSIFYPALPVMARELNTTETITNLSVAMYMLSMSIFPIWWSAFSEQYGRRNIYLTSFTMFVIFSVLCGFSVNISMLIVFRIGVGGASASVQAVGAGTIADIWESHERGRAMSMFYLGPLLGPLFAPIIGGALSQAFGWQSTMWFLAAFGFVELILLTILLPETLARKQEDTEPDESLRRMTTTESAKVQTRKAAMGFKHYVIDPLSVLLFLRFPPVLITVFLAAIAFGALFVVNISIQQKFSAPPYSYQQLIVGLLYIPSGLGYMAASFFGGKWLDNIMAREARRANRVDENGKLILLPEDRMRENMWIANTMYPIGLLIFGWTLHYGTFWFAPAVGAFIFGVSSMLVFAAATTMLTEFIRKKSSAGVAVNNFIRNILSCVGTIVAEPWITAMGVGPVLTVIAGVCMIIGFLGIFTLKRNASGWRKKMDEALKNVD